MVYKEVSAQQCRSAGHSLTIGRGVHGAWIETHKGRPRFTHFSSLSTPSRICMKTLPSCVIPTTMEVRQAQGGS